MVTTICDLFTVQHLQTLFIKIVNKNAYYSTVKNFRPPVVHFETSSSFYKRLPGFPAAI